MQFKIFSILLAKSTLLLMLLQGCQCRSAVCQAPPSPANGHVLYRSSGSSYVMYKCNPGHVLTGSRASLCLLGRWSPDAPKCVRANKQILRTAVQVEGPAPSASPRNVTLGSFGQKKIAGGDVKRRSVPPPGVNSDRRCPLPPLISKGHMIVSRFYPDRVTYVCENGYTLSNRHTLYCKNGRWDQATPRCLDNLSGREAPFDDHLARLDNPCGTDFGGCDQICYFSQRGKFCNCHGGYTQNETRCHDIDECGTQKHICPNKCVNTPGSYRCTCATGYKDEGDGKSCIDIDECAVDNGGCMRLCENTMGSYRCHCDIWGYDLAADGKTCIRQTRWIRDYCAHEKGGCAHVCRSGEGRAICSCRNGYKLSRDGKNCDDIDECYDGIAKCQHRCNNTPGSFECRCHPGYANSPTNKTQCIDIDECKVDNFGCEHECVNEPGSARCKCFFGFRLQEDGKRCARNYVDECSFIGNRSNCPHGCRNSEGGHRCFKNSTGSAGSPPPPEDDIEGSGYNDGTQLHYEQDYFIPVENYTCPHGYVASASGCKDVDECRTPANNCAVRCVNTPGGFYCACPQGYRLREDGISCDDIDECSAGAINCTGWCVNTPGSFYCECPAGYSVGEDRRSCDECPVNTYKSAGSDRCVKCPANSHTDGTGKISINDCVCNMGYRKLLDGGSYCQDIDECRTTVHNCSKLCVNTPGGFHCACPGGYSLAKDGVSCDDMDECAERHLHNCPEECVNTVGSFRCSCRPGRVLYGGTSHCRDCPPGTYKDDEFEQCEKCPANSHTRGRASTSKRDCICNQGYRGNPADGLPCQDIDECGEETLRCSDECVNVLGSAFCACPLGLRLKPDNLTCEDIDECSENPRVCSQLCTNTHGSYVCSCNPGYTLSSNDSYRCIDNDECATKKHGCSHTCVNVDGGYYCKCPEGFQMTADLRTCADITCPMFIDVPNSVTKCDHKRVDSSVPIGTRCTVHCNAGFELDGHASTVCAKNGTWTTELPTCKPLHCPSIQPPEHGSVLPDRCLQSNANYYKSRCYFQCTEGYKLDGFAVTTCQKNNKANPGGHGKDTELAWNRKPALCKKETPAIWITCPQSTTFILPPGQSSMQPDIPLPNTNAEQANLKLEVDNPHYVDGTLPYGDTKVTYVATRPETNETARCTFEVTIDDKEPPQVLRCPATVSAVATSLEGVTVTWEEPEFSDNVEVHSVEKSKEPGSLLNTGLHIVYYTAKDTAGNEAVCKFQVNVTRKECRLPADIEHGSTDCHPWLEGVVCEPSCDDGYALPNNVSLFYTCDLAGVWEPRSWIPHCQAYTPSPATGCLQGSEYFDELNGETDVCVECPPGMYWDHDVAQCFLCQQGFYQDQPAQSSCKPCPANATQVPVLSPPLEQQCFS